MSERVVGTVARVNGPVIHVRGVTDAMMMELVFVGEARLVGEIVKLTGDRAIVQVYEDTTGIRPTEDVYGSGMPLSVELGPGLIGTIYDGIQRPLEHIRDLTDQFIARGIQVPALDREARFQFMPALEAGTEVAGGEVLGTLQETERIEHRVLVPPDVAGTVQSVEPAGE